MRMTMASFRKLTGFLFVITPLWLFLNSRVLGIVSGFPDIQFAGPDELLRRVHESGTVGILTWYIYIVPGVLYIASIAMFQKVLEPERIPWFSVATSMGVTAWAIQFFGLVRWIFVYPYLADLWLESSNDPQKRDIITIVFNVFNNYAGYALGQTIGIGLTAVWILLVGIAIKKSPLFKPWLGYLGIAIAIGEAIGNLGPLGSVIPGIDIKTLFNISGLFWYISYAWMAYLGIIMMRAPADVYDDLAPGDGL
jgi:uncharacterized protein DUF4386